MTSTTGPRTLLAIGIGPGDPDLITVRAVQALRDLDVVLVLDKGGLDAELAAVREEVLARHVPGRGPRRLVVADPRRDRAVSGRAGAVQAWRDERTRRLIAAVDADVGPGERAGLLVWGDPSLYDGAAETLEAVATACRGEVQVEVVPGISAIQQLAAAHRVPLNRAGGSVCVMPGRRLAAQGVPEGVDDVVVVLDHGAAFMGVAEPVEMCWGAYLSTPQEVLVRGPLIEVRDRVLALREQLRADRGWLFDTYLLRRP